MNKRKVVIFVEGQTEQQFLRDVLLQWYEFDADHLGIQCHKLHSTSEFSVPFDYGTMDSETFYRIVDTSGEGNVLPAIRKNAERYASLGYEAVIGLRDMFCDAYHSAAQNRKIHSDINEKMIRLTSEQLPKGFDICYIRFAIMEIETWMLSMPELLLRIDSRLTAEYILCELGVDLNADLEKTLYHPAQTMKDVLKLVGREYNKHTAETSAVTSLIQKDACISLMQSDKCEAFRNFMQLILSTD